MLPVYLLILLLLLVASRPFFWGADSTAGKKAMARVLASAPEPQTGELSSFTRSFVVRDRIVIVASVLAVILLEVCLSLFDGVVPSTWVMLNVEATHLFLVLIVIQLASAVTMAGLATGRSFVITARVSDTNVARLNKVGVLDYVPKATPLFPVGLLAASAAVNLGLVFLGARGDVDGRYVMVSLLVLAGCGLVTAVAFAIAVALVRRGSVSRTRFGVFVADLVRLEALRALFAFAAGAAAVALMASFFAVSSPLAGLGEDAASGLAVLMVCVFAVVFVVLVRMTLRPTNPGLMKQLWGPGRENAQNA